MDPHTFSNYEDIRVIGIHLDLVVDFERKVLMGHTILKFKVLKSIDKVILDTKKLKIFRVRNTNKSLEWKLLNNNPVFGSPLEITLDNYLIKEEIINLSIWYETSPDADAIQ